MLRKDNTSRTVALSIEIYLKLKKDQRIKKNYLGQRYHLCFCRRPKSIPYNGPSILCRKSLTLCKRLTSLRDPDDVISQLKWSPRPWEHLQLFNSLLMFRRGLLRAMLSLHIYESHYYADNVYHKQKIAHTEINGNFRWSNVERSPLA